MTRSAGAGHRKKKPRYSVIRQCIDADMISRFLPAGITYGQVCKGSNQT